METDPTSQAPSLALKRIVYAVTKSNGGGAQAYVMMMSRNARDRGATVSVIAGSADGAKGAPGILFEELAAENISSIHLKEIQRDVGGISDWNAIKELVSVLREENPDILHLNSSKMGLLGGIAGRIAGVPRIIFTAHGWPHKEPRGLLWKLMAWAGSWVTIMCAHKIICVSEVDLRESPTLLFRDKLSLVHNGISKFSLLPREQARARLISLAPDLAKFDTWLVMNAELHLNKGIGTAIRALAELLPRHPNMALVICGDGHTRDALIELALSLKVSSHVFLLGYVPEARQYLLAGDIYLMPSRKEGLPIALLEAGLAALPVVASKVGGIPEVITDQQTGLFIPRSNTHILAKSISFLLNNPDKAARFGADLRTNILANFSEVKMVEETVALY